MTLSVSVYDTISQLESFIMVFYSVSGNMLYKSTGIIAKAMLAHSSNYICTVGESEDEQ